MTITGVTALQAPRSAAPDAAMNVQMNKMIPAATARPARAAGPQPK